MNTLIRFFANKEDVIPVDSHPAPVKYKTAQECVGVVYEIKTWLENHPTGKVDFIVVSGN